jgi:hypothetical protein
MIGFPIDFPTVRNPFSTARAATFLKFLSRTERPAEEDFLIDSEAIHLINFLTFDVLHSLSTDSFSTIQ